MKDKRAKVIIMQWVIPLLILLIAMGSLLLHFSITSRNKELDEVEKDLIDKTEDYASDFEYTIKSLMIASEPLGHFVENYSFKEVTLATNVMSALVENTDAYMAVMCNVDGEGIAHNGNSVYLGNEKYFAQISEEQVEYILCDNDGIEGRRCIITVLPLRKYSGLKGFLLVYYDVANFDNMLSGMKIDASTYYSVVDEHGESICENGASYTIFSKDDLWENILSEATNIEEVQQAKNRFDNDQSGIVKVELDGETQDKILIFAPIDINGWKFVVAVNYKYVDTLLMKEWEANRTVLIRLVMCMLIFAGAIAMGFIVTKFHESEKSKDLANKADTDLLTNLYNKAATERKIKDYMQAHPDEQAVLFVLDIDNFKKINDTMGHAFGDEVLRSLGHQIKTYFRVSDIIGRTGGDEFMIFLKGMKDDETILKEAHRLEYFFKNFKAGEYVKYSATASVGAAVFPRDAAEYGGLYKTADKALYIAKQRGKNQLAFYNEEPFKNKNS